MVSLNEQLKEKSSEQPSEQPTEQLNEQLREQRNEQLSEQRSEQRKKRRKKRMNPFLKLLIGLLAMAGVFLFLDSPIFAVENFTVEGNSYYLDEEILTMGNCKTGGNIFWGTDCSDIKARLEKDAYMSEVSVKRILPNTISITLSERKQIGAIVYGEKYVVIAPDGTVLRKTEVDPKVTVLSGLTISKLEMGEVIEVEEKVLFRQALELLREADAGGMFFKKIEIGKSSMKAYILDNLVCTGSAEHITEAVKEGKIQIVTEKLFDEEIERGTIKVSGDDNISFTPKID